MGERLQRAAQPDRSHQDGGDHHRCTELVDPADCPATAAGIGNPVAEDHIEQEQRAVTERKKESERLPGESDIGDRGHAAGGERQEWPNNGIEIEMPSEQRRAAAEGFCG